MYDYGIFTIPEAKLRGICTLAFGALIGAASGAGMCWGRVRNKLVAGVIGLAASFFGLYMSWIIWILHLVKPSLWFFNPLRAALHPRGLWHAMLAVNALGTWSYEGGTPEHGTFLWLVWACEALLVLGFGILTATALVQRRPFCERCGQWCAERRKLYFAPSLSAAQFKTLLESQDIGGLEKLTVGDKKKAHYRVDLHSCEVCHSLNTLSLVQNFPRDRKTVVDKLLVTPEQASAIRHLEMNRVSSAMNNVPAPTK
ncbi:MAG TPA: hypothetical protein VGR55_04365 [Candidatus Acidoferrum sp.]|nr:hypothetical protein [Candidatus Acidoferrum sp.]